MSATDMDHNCRSIPCCNEIVCGGGSQLLDPLPPWFHGLKKAGISLCIPCDMRFGKKFGVVESAECPVCLETMTGVTMPNCTHGDTLNMCWLLQALHIRKTQPPTTVSPTPTRFLPNGRREVAITPNGARAIPSPRYGMKSGIVLRLRATGGRRGRG